MQARICKALFVLIPMLFACILHAQVATGNYTYGTFDNQGFDSINLGNLNTHFSIPVLNKTGRGLPFSYNLAYDSSVWYPVTSGSTTAWTPTQNFGWTGNTQSATGYYSYYLVSYEQVQYYNSWPYYYWYYYWCGFTYVDKLGVVHNFPGCTEQVWLWSYSGQYWYVYNSYPSMTVSATDGSGYTLTVSDYSYAQVTTPSNQQIVPPYGSATSATVTDRNGNEITISGGTFTDTAGNAALTVAGSGTYSSPTTLSYTNPQGHSSHYTINYGEYTVATYFHAPNIVEYPPTLTSLVSSIQLPDGSEYTFTYEATPSAANCTPLSGSTYTRNCVTARLTSMTLPTGGTITYNYTDTAGYNGIETDGSTAGMTRTMSTGGTRTYSRTLNSGTPGSASTWTTTIEDQNTPANYTVANFAEDSNTTNPTHRLYETQRQVFQGSISANACSSTITNNCWLATNTACYNGTYSSCATANVSSPITQTDVYSILPNGTANLSHIAYNSYGLVTDNKQYNYGVSLGSAPSSSSLVSEIGTTYYPVSNGIANMVESVVVTDWSSGGAVTLASASYTYDGTAVTSTTGTPQHVAVTGARGNLTQATTWTTSTSSLTSTNTYYDTGLLNVATGVNGAHTTYVYGSGSCGNSFATTINGPLGLSTSTIWNCTGELATSSTDPNGNGVATGYNDSNYWRPTSVTDQLTNSSTITYIGENAVETSLTYNSGNSVSDSRSTVDAFGRSAYSQSLQGPGKTTYDTTEVDYNIAGQPYRTTMPYSAAASPSSGNSNAPATVLTYDALGRVLTRTDAAGGTVQYTYTNNDVLQTVTGAQSFKKQFEYDGLGRLTSVCEISTGLPGVGTCGQSSPQTGYWTKYTYDALGHILSVTQNAQAASNARQMRSYAYDWLGRMTSETNPETGRSGSNGTTAYTYDYIAYCGGSAYNYPGNLVQRRDNAGNVTCYAYDALNRVTQAGNPGVSNTTLRKFVYDSESSYPTGVTVTNGKTHMVEARTVNTSSPGTTITDEFFSYSARGEVTDVYESTPHSGGFYHTTATYWAPGALKTLSGIPGVPAINYGANGTGLDGEGRYTTVSAASGTNPVTNVAYSTSSTTNYLGALTGVTFGSGDGDGFTYDPNTARMASYSFSVNGQNDTGTLTWNSNGTLYQMAINDNITGTSDAQTCNYGYDDLRRVSSVNCGTIWAQTFSYDAFGNITKNVPGGSAGLTFLPTYYTTPPTNQFSLIPGASVSYDANGNLLTDNLNTYTWDPNWGNMLTVSTGAQTVTALYDALGRMVENNSSSSYYAFVYGPAGNRLAIANGQALVVARIALPGGAKAIYNSTGLAYYRHSDWLGSSRITSTASRALYSSTAYAPFGEQYGHSGAADASFTGQDQDTVTSLYDFQLRRYSPSQGRWISPDPSGINSVVTTKPQSWNRYAYAYDNPLALIDSLGLSVHRLHHVRAKPAVDDDDDDDDDGGVTSGDDDGGGGGGSASGDDDDDDDNNANQGCDFNCQLEQAEQDAINALQNPNCADAVDGGMGTAADALIENLAGQMNGGDVDILSGITIQPGDLGANDNGSGTGANTQGTSQSQTINGVNVYVGIGLPATVTINSNPDGMFLNPLPNQFIDNNIPWGLNTEQRQTVTILHELGHAAVYAGDPSAVVDDSSPNGPLSTVSEINSAIIAVVCLGGND